VSDKASLIAAAASLAVACASGGISVWATRSARRANRELEEFKNDLAQHAKERDARRDYEYDARKRLYADLEPIAFQLVVAADEAWHRVRSLARTAREGHLVPNDHWLANQLGYYSLSTMYKLYAPAAVIRMMQQRLTMVDLGLDDKLNAQYRLAKALFKSYTDAYPFARFAALPYDPDHKEWTDRRKKNPREYWKQGLTVGRVEAAADALIIADKDVPPRVMTWGEFENRMHEQASGVRKAFDHVWGLFDGFHPRTRPVLWQMLIAQTLLFQAFIDYGDAKRKTHSKVILSPADTKQFDWRGPNDDDTDEEAVQRPFRAAAEYVRSNVPEDDRLESASRRG
jgi:hypothetical protein